VSCCWRRATLWFAALIVLTTTSVVSAEPPADQLQSAHGHWKNLDYELVVGAAESVLANSAASSTQRVEALRLKGSALVVLNQTEDATAVFETLFAIDPAYQLPEGTSPRILGVFRPAKAAWLVQEERRLAMELGPALKNLSATIRTPARPRGGQPLTVWVDLADPGGIASSVVMGYRKRGTRLFSTLSAASRVGTIELTVPGLFTASDEPYVLEVFVEVRHRSGVPVFRYGSAEQPKTIAVAAGNVPKQKSVLRTWWFWTGTAALVTAAVAIPLLIASSRDVGPQDIVGRRR